MVEVLLTINFLFQNPKNDDCLVHCFDEAQTLQINKLRQINKLPLKINPLSNEIRRQDFLICFLGH
jgi:hypothetical protein